MCLVSLCLPDGMDTGTRFNNLSRNLFVIVQSRGTWNVTPKKCSRLSPLFSSHLRCNISLMSLPLSRPSGRVAIIKRLHLNVRLYLDLSKFRGWLCSRPGIFYLSFPTVVVAILSTCPFSRDPCILLNFTLMSIPWLYFPFGKSIKCSLITSPDKNK